MCLEEEEEDYYTRCTQKPVVTQRLGLDVGGGSGAQRDRTGEQNRAQRDRPEGRCGSPGLFWELCVQVGAVRSGARTGGPLLGTGGGVCVDE